MKKYYPIIIALICALLVIPSSLDAKKKKKDKKNEDVYQFTMVKELKTTPVKDQYHSGTCWSFSALSFLETELLRVEGPELDLSEMFVVRTNYTAKVQEYVRWHGKLNFAGGGNFHDVVATWKNHGLVPEETYPGIQYGEEKHKHGELDALLAGYANTVIKNKNKKLSTVWLEGFNGILDAYLGDYPEKFSYNGKAYTPKTFAKSIGLDPDDYVEITSYTHHPFYETFVLELPDNWMRSEIYNVPLDEFIQIIDSAVYNGYSVAWGGDVSNKGFQYKKHGIAVTLKDDFENMEGSEMSKWDDVPYRSRMDSLYKFEEIREEKVITQEIRQKGFDNWDVGDDHGVHVVGIAKDQNGNQYYYTKNSWNDDSNKFKGFYYMSVPYTRLNCNTIMVHRDAVPFHIRAKLKI